MPEKTSSDPLVSPTNCQYQCTCSRALKSQTKITGQTWNMNLGPMAHASHCSGKAHTMVYLQATGIGLQIHSLHSLHMLHPQLIYICRVHNYQKPLNNSVL